MQSLGALALSDFKAKVTQPRNKIEVYYGGSWQTPKAILSETKEVLMNCNTSIGGASPTVGLVAGSWSAKVYNPQAKFHPLHPTSTFTDVFIIGRKVRIFQGIKVGATEYFYPAMYGIINRVDYNLETSTIDISGMDYCQALSDYKLSQPYNYWGSSTVISTLGPVESLDAEIYAEADACEIGAGEAGNVTNWATGGVAAVSSVADAGGGSTYAMKILFGTGTAVLTFSTPGVFQWLCPTGVTSLQVESWGAGAGGGGNRSFWGAGGGGGGAYSKKTFAVVPGTLYSGYVGERGYGGDNDPVDDGTDGQDSWFGSTAIVLAKGGTGGERGAGHDSGNGFGGAGGAAASGVGDTKYSGGAGGNGHEGYQGAGGGGGSSAGTSANGNAGAEGGASTGGAGGAAPTGGGAGANGGNDDTDGDDAAANGGAGGGSGWDATVSEPYGRRGGDGADGKVVLTYTGTVSGDSVANQNIGAVVAGSNYKIAFKHKRVTGPGTMAARAYISTTLQGETTGLESASYVNGYLYFTASTSGDLILQFDITSAATGTEFRVDQISLKKILWTFYYLDYDMPANCTGVYYATMDGVPIWYGDDPDGWFYDTELNRFSFHTNRKVQAGTNNLVIYYHTAQVPEYVVADILVYSGLYSTRASALTAMTYTETGFVIDRVFFKTGTSGKDAIAQIAERCNYQFDFKYNGTPVFIPKPAIKAAGAEDLVLAANEVAAVKYIKNSLEFFNSVTIDGDDLAAPTQFNGAEPAKYKGVASDATSIAAYGEKNFSITNIFWQTQPTIDASAAAFLAALKDPKAYFYFDLKFCPIPVEIGDTIKITIYLPDVQSLLPLIWGVGVWGVNTWGSYYTDVNLRGLVRDIKVNDYSQSIILEIGV